MFSFCFGICEFIIVLPFTEIGKTSFRNKYFLKTADVICEKSMHDELSEFLKQVGSLSNFLIHLSHKRMSCWFLLLEH